MHNTTELRYLFEARMKDGTVIRQTLEDVSTVEPLTRSAFYDVAQRLDDVVLFGLFNDKNSYVVDLRDGHFEINGVPFSAQPVTTPVINDGGKFKLVYFRDHQQELVMSAEGNSKLGTHHHQYRMGWEYTDPNGRIYQQTIVII